MIIAIPTNNVGKEVPVRSQNAAYCEYVSKAGFNPILIPMESDPEVIAEVADGLLLAGGIDIDPIYYGFSNVCSFKIDPKKDAFERALFYAFLELDKPVFGICRGFQLIFRELLKSHPNEVLLNKYFDYVENIEKHNQTSLEVAREFPFHQVVINTKSLLGGEEGRSLLPVNSMHHQAVTYNFGLAEKNLVPEKHKHQLLRTEPSLLNVDNVEVLAWTMRGVRQPSSNKKPDFENYETIVEAVKIHNWGGAVMGVQWHPEELGDVRLIKKFFSKDATMVA